MKTATEYCNDETFKARRSGKNIVLEFRSEDESGDESTEAGEDEG